MEEYSYTPPATQYAHTWTPMNTEPQYIPPQPPYMSKRKQKKLAKKAKQQQQKEALKRDWEKLSNWQKICVIGIIALASCFIISSLASSCQNNTKPSEQPVVSTTPLPVNPLDKNAPEHWFD